MAESPEILSSVGISHNFHTSNGRRICSSKDEVRAMICIDGERQDMEVEESWYGQLAVNDPQRLMLIHEEAWWALDIKIAIEGAPELENLSDFMYAQLALICQDDVEDAVSRARALQWYRREHGIVESYEEGRCALNELLDLQPEWLLYFGFDHCIGKYSLIHDIAKCNMTALNSEEKVHKWYKGMYYLLHALGPDPASIRRGSIIIAECDGLDWTKEREFSLLQAFFVQLGAQYPFSSRMSNYHTCPIFHSMVAALKSSFPTVSSRHFLVTGLTCRNRLDTICMVPSAQAATERLMAAMTETLRMRFDNEANFSLARYSNNLM
jgi:hypothetical protein